MKFLTFKTINLTLLSLYLILISDKSEAFWSRGELKVVHCSGEGTSKTIAFNNKTADLYNYDEFTEGYVKKKKINNQ